MVVGGQLRESGTDGTGKGTGEIKYTQIISVGNRDRKMHFGRSRCRREDSVMN